MYLKFEGNTEKDWYTLSDPSSYERLTPIQSWFSILPCESKMTLYKVKRIVHEPNKQYRIMGSSSWSEF